MSTVIVPTVNSIAMDDRRPVQFMAAFFAALGYHVRTGIHAVSDLLERRFGEFAGVPYLGPVSRQQWEQLWATEAQPQQPAAEPYANTTDRTHAVTIALSRGIIEL